MLTQLELKENLHYDPETGVFTRIKAQQGRRWPIGAQVGAIYQGGYRYVGVCSRIYQSHRLVFLYMTGEFPAEEIDHINGVRDDNRWNNLRAVSHAENSKNQSLSKTNTSGYYGVQWIAVRHKWRARITVWGKRIHIGLFIDKEAAIEARRAAEIQHGFHPNHGAIRARYPY